MYLPSHFEESRPERRLVGELTERHERQRDAPWQVDDAPGAA